MVIGIPNHLSHFLIVTSVVQDRRTIMEDVAIDARQGPAGGEEEQHMRVSLLSTLETTA